MGTRRDGARTCTGTTSTHHRQTFSRVIRDAETADEVRKA
jgi:hypothetical protein